MKTIKRIQAMWLLFPLYLFGAGVVTDCTEANLRAAMSGGGLVTFACDGTITLASTITNALDTVLDASGRHIIISGNHAVRVFFVNSNVSFTTLNLTIANGRSDKGSGIFNDGGTLAVRHCCFAFNDAIGKSRGLWGLGENGAGGALFNTGIANIANATFATNSARGGDGVVGDNANGGFGRSGGSGYGGAICNFGSLIIDECKLQDNSASGGVGGDGVAGQDYPYGMGSPGEGGGGGSSGGGAVFSTNEFIAKNSLFVGNQVRGGNAGSGGRGGFRLYGGENGEPRGASGGDGGGGSGAALWNSNGVMRISNCTLAHNEVSGGPGGGGGRGGDTMKYNGGTGGNGGAGGSGLGVLYAFGDSRVVNCTIASNRGIAGVGGVGGAGGTIGGIFPAAAGTNGLDGAVLGGVMTFECRMVNTLLATNTPGGNLLGRIVDDGGNLSSDASYAFTNGSSLNNTPPKLGPLGDNGGSTLTMALLAGSRAIDTGISAAAPFIDQRGVPRPFGNAVDIGAYEYAPLLSISRFQSNIVEILLRDAIPGQMCRLLTSTGLSSWVSVATNRVGSGGTTVFQTSINVSEVQRYYRVVSP